MSSLRVVFMGTPEFARAALDAVLASHHTVVAVVSQPDRPKGRGQAMQPPPVAARARELGIPLLQPLSCKDQAFRDAVAAFAPDVAVVAAFGHILGPKALAIPRLGCVNVHASALPRWRGASPITAAIRAGDPETGIAIMQMDVGMDTGPVFCTQTIPIAPDDTGETLHDKLASLGGALLVPVLDQLAAGTVVAVPQPTAGVTMAPKLGKHDADLDWTEPAAALERQIRALHPWPGTRAWLATAPDTTPRVVRVLPLAHVVPMPAPAPVPGQDAPPPAPGAILQADACGVIVACGDGLALRLELLQLEGKKPLPVAQLLQGFPIARGMAFVPRPSDAP